MRLAYRFPQGPHHGVCSQLQGHIVGSVAVRVAQWTHDGERGHEERALLLHQRQRLVVNPSAMLDAAHACAHCGVRPTAAMGVGSHVKAFGCRLLHHRLHLFHRQFLTARIGGRQPCPLTGAHLQDVRPARNDRTGHFPHIVHPMQRLRVVPAELRKTENERLAQDGANMTRRSQHLRPHYIVLTNQVASGQTLQISITQYTGGGNTRKQGAFCRGRIANMGMRIDIPRQQIRALQVDAGGLRGPALAGDSLSGIAGSGRNAGDTPVHHTDVHQWHIRATAAINEMSVD